MKERLGLCEEVAVRGEVQGNLYLRQKNVRG